MSQISREMEHEEYPEENTSFSKLEIGSRIVFLHDDVQHTAVVKKFEAQDRVTKDQKAAVLITLKAQNSLVSLPVAYIWSYDCFTLASESLDDTVGQERRTSRRRASTLQHGSIMHGQSTVPDAGAEENLTAEEKEEEEKGEEDREQQESPEQVAG